MITTAQCIACVFVLGFWLAVFAGIAWFVNRSGKKQSGERP